jgi:hypothetical protein
VSVVVVVVVVVVVGALVGTEVVVVGVVVVGEAAVVTVVVDVSPPLLEAITARATTSPITAATSRAMAHFAPRLRPPARGGSPEGGGPG